MDRPLGVAQGPQNPSIARVQVEPAPSVTLVEIECDSASEEACNALDDNCDGVIDEGCGYATGQLQCTLAWTTHADLDLYVTDPNGETLSYAHPRTASGGHLDHHRRGACVKNPDPPSVENARWPAGHVVRGPYVVEAHYIGECGSEAGPTAVTLSVSANGSVQGPYNVFIHPAERMTILTLHALE